MVRRGYVLSIISIVGFLCGPCFAQNNDESALVKPSTETADLDVLFTGRLLGYFRNPSLQSGASVDPNLPCPRVNVYEDLSNEAKLLVNSTQSFAYDSRVFVGTGDNFAVYLPSRIFEPSPAQGKGQQYDKDQFDWDGASWVKRTPISIARDLRNGLVMVPTDNVGCFLSYAGYDAIVPGKEDFYFGVDRLRALARFLASIPKTSDSPYRPVQMLAANLLVKTTWFHPGHDPIPDSKKKRLSFEISDLSQTPNPYFTFPSDGTEILPWLAEIEASVNFDPRAAEIVISESLDSDGPDWATSVIGSQLHIDFPKSPRCWAVPDDPNSKYHVDAKCVQLKVELTAELKTELEKADASKPYPTMVARWRLTRLNPLPSGNYKACIWPEKPVFSDPKVPVRPTCSRFTVGVPLLQYIDPQQVPATASPQAQVKIPSPYLVKRVCSHFAEGTCKGQWNTAAVFGAVDPDMEEKIGKLESDWRAMEKDGKKNPTCEKDPKCDNDKNAKKYETALEVVNPANSLKQLIDYLLDCGKFGNSTQGNDCYGAAPSTSETLTFKSKILLAQMDAGTASLLAAHLTGKYHFDAVISEYDQQQFTRNQITVIDPTLSSTGNSKQEEMECESPHCDVPTFVVVPPQAWDATWNGDPVRVLSVSHLDAGQVQYVVSGATTKRSPGQAICDHCVSSAAAGALAGSQKPLGKKFKLSDLALDRLVDALSRVYKSGISYKKPAPLDEPAATNVLAYASLYAMLKETNADVALLQKHDLYLRIPLVDCLLTQLPPSVPPASHCPDLPISPVLDHLIWQKILDNLLWKGDILTVIPVRGSVLLAIMKDSHQFDVTDKSGLSLVKESRRGLLTLGIKADGFKDSYLINDLPLDPNRLYSVATTDYVALGDTGYPELIDLSVPKFPRPLWDKRPQQYISGIVCNALIKTLPPGNGMECTSDFSGKDYFDELYVRTPAPPAGNTWQEAWKAWFLFKSPLGQDDPEQKAGMKVKTDKNGNRDPDGKYSLYPDPENWAQEEPPAWRFSLDKTSIGFAIQRHSDSQANLNKNFGGVQNPQATAPRSHSWNIDQEASYTFNHHVWDFVSTEALLYNAAFTDAKSGAYRNQNQATDSFTLSLGPRFHLPAKRKLPHWGIGTYFHYDTQPFRFEQSLNLTNPITGVNVETPLQFFQPRVHTLTDRLSIGRYDQKSYFEVGLEGGRAFGAFDQFDIYTNGVLVLTCVPSATVSLPKCVGNHGDVVTPTSLVRTIQTNRARTGLYWHSFLNFPVGKRMSASLENQGAFYFNNAGDNSTDTRLQHLVTAKYSFQVWPSLSFGPTYQIFLFENKQAYQSLWQQQAMLTINFNFNLTSRRIAASQLRYQPTQPQ
jgi:hypothetical protein